MKNIFLRFAALFVVISFLTPVMGFADQKPTPVAPAAITSPVSPVPTGSPVPASAESDKTDREIPPLLLNVEKVEEIATDKNPRLVVARAQIKDARGRFEQLKSSRNFTMNFQGSYIRMDPIAEFELPGENGGGGGGGGGGGPTAIKLGNENNYSFKLILNKVIHTFGNLENSLVASALQVDAQNFNYETVRQDVLYHARSGYYQALKAQSFVGVAEENLNIARGQLKLTNDLFNAGVVPRFDVLRAELGVSRARQAVVTAENAKNLAVAALLNTMGLPQATPVQLEEDRNVEMVKIDEEKAQSTALDNRPEVTGAKITYQSLEYLLKAAHRSNAPVLSFNSTIEERNAAGLMATPRTHTSLLMFQIPIMDGGLKRAKVTQAEASLDSLKGTLEQLYQGVQLEVKQAVLTLDELAVKLEAARKDVETSREGYAIARTRYENGLSTQLELDDSQKNLITSQIEYYNVLYDYNIALARLERAIGISWKGVVENERR